MQLENKQFSRFYRPTSLRGYIGNEKAKDTVENMLKKDKLPQSILLYGMTGCGKTTLARLIAKEYLCENKSDGKSCGVCDTCQMLDHYIKTGDFGGLQDLKEVDITASSGKDDITELLEEMSYPSFTGGWKVYIMDEVQMASKQAQQRMLKQLEEPTEKVCVIFCTTNPEMILDTLKNRCTLKLQVKKPAMSELVGLLKFVCGKEGIQYDLQGLKMICSRADFIIREALQLLDQLVQSRGTATEDAFIEEFNEVGERVLFSFFRSWLGRDILKYLSVLHEVRLGGGFSSFLTSAIGFLSRGVYVANGLAVDGMSEFELKGYSDLFKKFSDEQVGELLSALLELRSCRDLESGLMCLIFKEGGTKEVSEVKPSLSKSDSTVKESSFRGERVALSEKETLKRSVEEVKELNKPVGSLSSIFNLKRVEVN